MLPTIDYEGGHNNKVADFIDVLRGAKETVTISYANKTFEYDVTQLPTAEDSAIRHRRTSFCGHHAFFRERN
jgi:hypothetical protein